MFSEYASRFLAQSQSRISFAPTNERRSGDDRSRRQNTSGWRLGTNSRNSAQRAPNTYQPTSSQVSGFPFASRLNPQQAPLFYSATDEFREENDEEEHEREIADFYALQRSRRQLGGSDLKESSDAGNGSGSSVGDSGHGDDRYDRGNRRAGGIRSSWRGGLTTSHAKGPGMADLSESAESQMGPTIEQVPSNLLMVDVGLEDTLRSDADDEPPEDLMEDPPSVQLPRKPAGAFPDGSEDGSDHDSGQRRLLGRSTLGYLEAESVPEVISNPLSKPPRHDAFFGHVYLLALAAMFATWFLVFLHNPPPGKKQPMGDTIYTTLHGSFGLLATYTVISIFVSLFWLAALRSYVRHLVYGILVAVPIILYSFSLYPLISSFKGATRGNSSQDSLMRWGSIIPAAIATLWILAVIRGRLAMQKAISILEFATRILASNPALILVGFAVLTSVVGFTWIWLSMFTRVFLGGHPSTRSTITRFVIDTSTWWLALYFILVYLWTIGMIFGIQRTVTSATVSQWYFHRLAVPAPTSQTVVKAALNHSGTTLFGTIALFTSLSLLVRLPLLVLPRRMTVLLGVAMYSLIPSPIAILINPLTLTYAAIHSQPLSVSGRGLTQMHFLAPNDATTSLHPNTFSRKTRDGWSGDASPLLPYRLSKLLLHATRFIMSLALGFGGWVTTARSLKVGDSGVRGSIYAYIVGLIAGAIGWGILGAMEGVLACIVDAVVVCWGSEVGSSGRGEARYCREAGYLFSEKEIPPSGRVSLA